MERWINGDGSTAYPPLEDDMVDISQATGTAVMGPEDIKRERELREAAQRLAQIKRDEETRNLWHAFSKLAPFAVSFLVLCAFGLIGFTAFKFMSDAWRATDWVW